MVHSPEGELERVLVGLGEGVDGFVLARGLRGLCRRGIIGWPRFPRDEWRDAGARMGRAGPTRFTRYRAGERSAAADAAEVGGSDRSRPAGRGDRLAARSGEHAALRSWTGGDCGRGEGAGRGIQGEIEITEGEALERGYPMVHAVGKGPGPPRSRASSNSLG